LPRKVSEKSAAAKKKPAKTKAGGSPGAKEKSPVGRPVASLAAQRPMFPEHDAESGIAGHAAGGTGTALVVTDVDNTVFDWVRYYTTAMQALFDRVHGITGIPVATLASESRDVFTRHGSIEYPFLIQELPSIAAHFDDDIDRILCEVVEPGRAAFMQAAESTLLPYPDVPEALAAFRKKFGTRIPLVALTDAPRYVAMWKLSKLGLLKYFDAVYGLPDPRIPTCGKAGRVKVDPEILLKHLQQSSFGFSGKIRILPDEYEKPGTRGLKTVLMDYELDETPEIRHRVVWIGDNPRKDIALGRKLGVTTLWAKYGVVTDKRLFELLHAFSPIENIHKNAAVEAVASGGAGQSSTAAVQPHEPDAALGSFAEFLQHLVAG